MATQAQYNTTTQAYRDVDIKLEVLDYNYYIVDEISGLVESASFDIDADSDIRRTCNVTMQLKDEFSEDPLHIANYWDSGNPFWFDKYLRIKIGIKDIMTDEYVWNNQGIYLINQPSVTYDAENNSLSFQAVDLMAKFTGLRNGNLEGLEYVINAGVAIKDIFKDILQQQGFQQFIILDPPQATTPYEIRISAGGTAYELMSELRDINPNWEMFFDVDGTFYFQQITNEETLSSKVITPIVSNDMLQALSFGYQLDTSFESIKNYIEVYGAFEEADKGAEVVSIQNGEINLNIADVGFLDNDGIWIIGFSISGEFEELNTYLTKINIFNNSNKIGEIDTSSLPLKYSGWDYRIRVYVNDGISTFNYAGYAQPVGIVWDDNPNSPFYVGELANTSNIISSPTDAIATSQNPMPRFTNQIRIVLSGGEYDNIYSNQLAIDRAKHELYLRARRHDDISINLLPIYWLDVNQLIEYKLPNEDKVSYWLIKKISTGFEVNGTQTISAVRQYI